MKSIIRAVLSSIAVATIAIPAVGQPPERVELNPPVRSAPSPTEIVARTAARTDGNPDLARGPIANPMTNFALYIAKFVVPDKYENTKHWGKKKTIRTGVRLNRDDGKLRLRSRKRDVNHGSWYFYRIWLTDEKQFQVKLEEMQETESGHTFRLVVEAPVAIFARHAMWNLGVQLWSVHADVDARIRVRANCSLDVQLNPTKVPPDVELVPQVHDIHMELLEFRVTRFSQLGSDITSPFSKTIRELVEDEFEERRPSLPEKINQKLAKKRGAFTLSIQDLLKSKLQLSSEGGSTDVSNGTAQSKQER